MARAIGAPVYTQLDVRVELRVEVSYTSEKAGNSPPTLRIARGAVEWAKQRGFKELWIVAAKPHLWRALRDTKQAVREIGEEIKVRACTEVWWYPEDSWFCLDSTQAFTRSQGAWSMRDIILKLMPFFIYKRIAN